MPPKQQSKNNKQQVQSVTNVTVDSLKKMLDKNDFSGFRNLILGNYNNPIWKKTFNYKNTQPTISFVGGIILQDAIMKIFSSMKKSMFDAKRLDYFKSPVFVQNFMTEIKHVTKISDVKLNEEDSLEYGKWILDIFNACFKVRDVYGGGSAGDECKRVLWKNSSKDEYMQNKENKCYICERAWLSYNKDGTFVCSSNTKGTTTFDLNLVHCEHIVPFLAALYHVKLARSGDSLDDPILDTQYALAHKGCNELKADYQMYMKVSELKSNESIGGSNISDTQDGGEGVVTRSQAQAIIENNVAPDRLMNKLNKLNTLKQKLEKEPEKKRKSGTGDTAQPEERSELDDIYPEFKFMYIPNMDMIDTLYDAIDNARHEHWGVDKNNNPIKFNTNSVTLNTDCGKITLKNKDWKKNKSYPILPRLRAVLKYINTNIDKLRTDNTPQEQVEMLYDLWGKFKLIFAISPEKLDQIVLRGGIETKSVAKGGGDVQVGGAESDYDIMKGYIRESVNDLFGAPESPESLNIPLQIYGRFQLILGMTMTGLNPNNTYYKFKMTFRNSSDDVDTADTTGAMLQGEDNDVTPSVVTINRIHKMVNGIYQYVHDTKNNLKYLQKVVDGREDKFFIMKDPTDPLYAVEYVNFGSVKNSNRDKTFGIYTVFSKDSGNRSLNGGSRGGNIDDISVDKDNDSDKNESDDEENESDVRYANFRRVLNTRRVRQNSKNRKTFKKKQRK